MPPIKVFNGGCSFIIIHTHKEPKILSSKKISVTSGAGVSLGAIVRIIKGIGKIIKHIRDK